jgi:hypothetical protein
VTAASRREAERPQSWSVPRRPPGAPGPAHLDDRVSQHRRRRRRVGLPVGPAQQRRAQQLHPGVEAGVEQRAVGGQQRRRHLQRAGAGGRGRAAAALCEGGALAADACRCLGALFKLEGPAKRAPSLAVRTLSTLGLTKAIVLSSSSSLTLKPLTPGRGSGSARGLSRRAQAAPRHPPAPASAHAGPDPAGARARRPRLPSIPQGLRPANAPSARTSPSPCSASISLHVSCQSLCGAWRQGRARGRGRGRRERASCDCQPLKSGAPACLASPAPNPLFPTRAKGGPALCRAAAPPRTRLCRSLRRCLPPLKPQPGRPQPPRRPAPAPPNHQPPRRTSSYETLPQSDAAGSHRGVCSSSRSM